MPKFCRLFFISIFFTTFTASVHAQVSSVTFGKNRVQYRKLHWQYYQTENFNVYFYEQGQELAKYVLQIAEKELPEIEAAAEYSLQRRANIIVYNNYADFSKTNVGLNTDIMNTNSTTKLVNNKLLVYYDANHYNLRIQIREGLADVITKNLFFGDVTFCQELIEFVSGHLTQILHTPACISLGKLCETPLIGFDFIAFTLSNRQGQGLSKGF